MQIFTDLKSLRNQVKQWKTEGLRVAFVPTMGNLHLGHLTLIENAHQHADKVISSIFVNPMQFNDPTDLQNYPRTEEADINALKAYKTDVLFLPDVKTIYPAGIDKQTFVEVPKISDMYCGNSRPNHFRGVTTVVCKLFNLVQPDVALFGEKDFQQLFVIRRMVTELCMDIEVVGVPTVREASGLAMSSRNNRLTDHEKHIAPAIYQTLTWIRDQIASGNKNVLNLIEQANKRVTDAGFKEDYFHILDANTLEAASETTQSYVVLAAAYLGQSRLIDNLAFKLN